jgi:hypothetical protein
MSPLGPISFKIISSLTVSYLLHVSLSVFYFIHVFFLSFFLSQLLLFNLPFYFSLPPLSHSLTHKHIHTHTYKHLQTKQYKQPLCISFFLFSFFLVFSLSLFHLNVNRLLPFYLFLFLSFQLFLFIFLNIITCHDVSSFYFAIFPTTIIKMKFFFISRVNLFLRLLKTFLFTPGMP